MSRSAKMAFVAGGVALSLATVVSYVVIRQGDANAEAKDVLEASEAEKPVPVSTVEAVQGTVIRTLSTSSTLEAEQSAEILAKVSGVVVEVAVREGRYVEKGQILAKIDDEDKRLALEKAELTLKKAEAELSRAELSFEQKLISRFDYEKANFDRDLARNARETALLELRHTDVKAPFAGRVTAKTIVPGKAVQAGDHLFTLADFRTLIVRLFLPEKDVFQLEPGQPVRLVPEALADSASAVGYAGRVRDISPVVDAKTGTVKVTVEVVDRTADLRPGAFVRAEIETDRKLGAVLVPKLAVVTEGARQYLFVAQEGRAVRRDVELGYAQEASVEVLRGVSAGEPVIVAGQTSLEGGERIEVLE